MEAEHHQQNGLVWFEQVQRIMTSRAARELQREEKEMCSGAADSLGLG